MDSGGRSTGVRDGATLLHVSVGGPSLVVLPYTTDPRSPVLPGGLSLAHSSRPLLASTLPFVSTCPRRSVRCGRVGNKGRGAQSTWPGWRARVGDKSCPTGLKGSGRAEGGQGLGLETPGRVGSFFCFGQETRRSVGRPGDRRRTVTKERVGVPGPGRCSE